MERQEILDMMGQLKLVGMRSAYDEVIEDGIRRQQPMPYVVGALLQAQIAAAHARSIAYQMGMARFPMAKTLAQFDFSASPVNEALIRERHDGGFLDQQRNLIVVGGTGTGKTHVAVAIASNCVRRGRKARFYNTVDLVNRLDAEARVGKAGHLAASLTQVDLVILDELGYLPFPQAGGQMLFHLLAIRSTKGELESRCHRMCSCDSGASCAGWTSGPGRAAQAASRRGLRGRRGQGRVASAGRRAEHGACGWPVTVA